MESRNTQVAADRPNRRALAGWLVFMSAGMVFLGSAAGTRGQAVPKDADSVDLPTTQVRSTDPTLPGTWYILDRSKPVRKLVDRKSLLPVGRRSLVLVETSRTVTLTKPTRQAYLIAAMPADVGDEQTLLGCLPWARTKSGEALPFTVVFHQARGRGTRIAQLALDECPGDVPVVMGIDYVLLNPPALTASQKAATSKMVSQRAGQRKITDDRPGFPKPAFTEGGPEYVGAAMGKSHFQTIYNVLKATDKVVAHSLEPQFETYDPDKAKANQKGPCGPRSRVAEKALVGVARAVSVSLLDDEGPIPHVFLLIEDPETGAYFIGDVSVPEPGLTAHWGNCYILGPAQYDGIPNPYQVRFEAFLSRPFVGYFTARGTQIKANQPMTLTGSSNPGRKESAQFQERLKKLPQEFRDLERKLLKD